MNDQGEHCQATENSPGNPIGVKGKEYRVMKRKGKFWRRRKVYLLMLAMLLLVLSSCSKHVVRKKLVDALQIKDPPIETLHSAYLLEDAVIVEFSVADSKPHESEYKKLAERYWAVLVPSPNRWGAPSYKFNRSPLPQEKVENAIPLNIHRLAKGQQIQRYTRSREEDEFPLITMRESRSVRNGGQASWGPNTVYRTAENARGSTGYSVSWLRPDGYIPKRRLPLLILGYPFAFVGDAIVGIPDLPAALVFSLFGPPGT